jgi:outer membrane lipase/esterase
VSNNHLNFIASTMRSVTLLSTGFLLVGNAHATQSGNISNVSGAILAVCPNSVALPDLQTRCNAVVGAGLPSDIMTQVTSEQTAAQKSAALEMNNMQLNTLSNRIAGLRSGSQSGGLNISGLFLDEAGMPFSSSKMAASSDSFDRLGIFVNGHIGFGDRVTTSNEAGYNLDNHGATIGLDYRFTDNFLMGAAFGYDNSVSRYVNNLGKLEADSYTGAIYASFFTDNGFFVDGVFSGSYQDYQSSRHIEYTVSESINTNALGDNTGDAFNVSMNTGYNFNLKGLTITPHVRVDYTTHQVDALNERGGLGWELHVNEQDFDSLQTAAGVQLSYAWSIPWGVIVPTVSADYIHEFKNDQRNITARFIQDTSNTNFLIATDTPDRDYIIMNAGLSAQFTHGISAFVSYDTVQAHSFVSNHNFTGGVRVELSF